MSSPDFAAAEARVLARRNARARVLAAESASATQLPPSLERLPPGLRGLAQSGLNAWDTVRSPYGTRPAFRVGQVDAELLDEELLQLLKGQVGDALKYFGGHLTDDWSAEILAGLRLILWKLSIWDRGTSYGASLQGLRYVDARLKHARSGTTGADPSRWQKIAYGMLTVGGRYGWQKWEDWLLEREGGYEQPSSAIQRLSRFTQWFSTTYEVAALASFLVFLYNGCYRTLVDRVLKLRLTPSSAHTNREVSFEYLNRQLVWHAFTEFLLFILPLVGISRWKRWLARLWKKGGAMIRGTKEDEDETVGRGELGFLPERTCAICYRDQNPTTGASEADVLAASGSAGGVIGSAQTDVTNPYEAIPCGCIYCFVCIAHRLEAEEGEGWTCLRCGEIIKECKPWNGDIVEEVISRSTSGSKSSRKSVVFADEEQSDDDEQPDTRRMSQIDPVPLDDEAEFTEDADPGAIEDDDTMGSGDWVAADEAHLVESDEHDDDQAMTR